MKEFFSMKKVTQGFFRDWVKWERKNYNLNYKWCKLIILNYLKNLINKNIIKKLKNNNDKIFKLR